MGLIAMWMFTCRFVRGLRFRDHSDGNTVDAVLLTPIVSGGLAGRSVCGGDALLEITRKVEREPRSVALVQYQ